MSSRLLDCTVCVVQSNRLHATSKASALVTAPTDPASRSPLTTLAGWNIRDWSISMNTNSTELSTSLSVYSVHPKPFALPEADPTNFDCQCYTAV